MFSITESTLGWLPTTGTGFALALFCPAASVSERTELECAMPTVTLARNAMATRFELVLHGANEIALRAAGEEALAEVDRVENQLSLYRHGSEIAQLNARAATESVRVSPEVFSLLQRAARLSAETEGAFDITIAPLVRCWGFMGAARTQQRTPPISSLSSPKGGEGRGEEASLSSVIPSPQPSPRLGGERESDLAAASAHRKPPTCEEIAAARAVVGMNHVILNAAERTVGFTKSGVMLDLGAIGKGYAIERSAELLREAGVTSALLHGGTSTAYAIGHPPDAEHWRVAIEPKTEGGLSHHEFRLRDESLSVSAIWARAFQAEGKQFGHVIDPRTGQPVTEAVLSAVILPSATETDALSTALLALGLAGHEKISQLRPGMRSLVMNTQGDMAFLPEPP